MNVLNFMGIALKLFIDLLFSNDNRKTRKICLKILFT